MAEAARRTPFFAREIRRDFPGALFAEKLCALFADRLVRWYRKPHHPRVFRQNLQFRLRIAWRLLLDRSPPL